MSFVQDGWGASGPPKCVPTDEGKKRKNEIRTDFRTERRIKLQFQGVGAHPWLLERRNGLAGGIYNRLIEDDRFSNTTFLAEVQWHLNAMPSAVGPSAYVMVLRSNPVDLFG